MKNQLIYFSLLLSVFWRTVFAGCKYDIDGKIAGVPRRNFGLSSVSSDISSYDIFAPCEYESEIEVCFTSDFEDIQDDPSLLYDRGDAANENSLVNYGQAIVMLVAIGIAFAVFCVLFAFCGCCMKCCCMSRNKDFKYQYGPDTYYEYPRSEVVFSYFCLALFIFTMSVLLLLGLVRGSVQVRDAMISAKDAPDGAAELVQGIPDPFLEVAIAFLGTTIVQLTQAVRDTVFETIDIENVHQSFLCVGNITDVVNADILDSFLVELDKLETLVEGGLTIPSAIIADLQNEITILETAVSNTASIINDFALALSGVDIAGPLASIQAFENQLAAVSAALTILLGSLNAFNTLDSSIAATISDANDFNTLGYGSNPSLGPTFVASASAFDSAVDNIDDGTTLLSNINDVKTELENLGVALRALQLEISELAIAVALLPDVSELNSVIDDTQDKFDNFDLDFIKESILNITADLPDAGPLLDQVNLALSAVNFIPCVLEVADVPF